MLFLLLDHVGKSAVINRLFVSLTSHLKLFGVIGFDKKQEMKKVWSVLKDEHTLGHHQAYVTFKDYEVPITKSHYFLAVMRGF